MLRAFPRFHAQIALRHFLRQLRDVAHVVNQRVQIIRHLVEIALIRERHFFWNVPFGNPIHARGAHVDRRDEGVNHAVHANHQLAPAAFEGVRVAASAQLSSLHRGNQAIAFLNKRVHRRNQRVQADFDVIHVALIRLRDRRQRVASGDAAHVIGGERQRDDDRIEHSVDAADNAGVFAVKSGLIAPDCQFSFPRRRREVIDFFEHCFQRGGHRAEGLA